MKHTVTVGREKRGLGRREAAALVKRAACRALDAEGVGERCMINVLFSDDEGVRRVNREVRGVDSATATALSGRSSI